MENEQYEVLFFKKENGTAPALDYIKSLPKKEKTKVFDHLNALSAYPEFRREPQSRQLEGKLRELKVDFGNDRYRVIYFFYVGKRIIVAHAFHKKTRQTPRRELETARRHMQEFLNIVGNR